MLLLSWINEREHLLLEVELDNKDGSFYPGMFVKATIFTGKGMADVVVSQKALHFVDGHLCVFIQETEGFKAIPVKIGRQSEEDVAIVSGLHVGQKYVSNGAFTLKGRAIQKHLGRYS